jgi:hypothetical protein
MNTGTDGATDYGDDEDVEVAAASPGTLLGFKLWCLTPNLLFYVLTDSRPQHRLRSQEEAVVGEAGAEGHVGEGEALIQLAG